MPKLYPKISPTSKEHTMCQQRTVRTMFQTNSWDCERKKTERMKQETSAIHSNCINKGYIHVVFFETISIDVDGCGCGRNSNSHGAGHALHPPIVMVVASDTALRRFGTDVVPILHHPPIAYLNYVGYPCFFLNILHLFGWNPQSHHLRTFQKPCVERIEQFWIMRFTDIYWCLLMFIGRSPRWHCWESKPHLANVMGGEWPNCHSCGCTSLKKSIMEPEQLANVSVLIRSFSQDNRGLRKRIGIPQNHPKLDHFVLG